MRLDKFLKVSRIIRRRTVANEACARGRVSLNDRIAKPGTEVKPGDILTVRFGEHIGKYEILEVRETVKKDESRNMYRIISEDETMKTERNQE